MNAPTRLRNERAYAMNAPTRLRAYALRAYAPTRLRNAYAPTQ